MNKENLHLRGTFGKLIQNIPHTALKDTYPQTQQGGSSESDINNQIESQQIKVNDLIDIILYDPMLKSLQECLEKQAQTKKKAQLLQTFPNRYRNLLNTQSLFKKLQLQTKQYQQQTMQVISLMQKQKQDFIDQISYLKAEIQCKQNQKAIKTNEMLMEQQQKDRYHENEIKNMKATIQHLNSKILKSKLQKDHLFQYTEEIKQDLCQIQAENDRLVAILKNYQFQIKQFKEKSSSNQQSLQKEIDNLKINEDKYKILIQEKNTQICQKDEQFKAAQLSLKIQQLKIEQFQSQVQRMKDAFQAQNIKKFQQIQQVRKRLLEQIKLKHELQELLEEKQVIFDENYEQKTKIIEQLSMANTKLELQLANLTKDKYSQIENLSNSFKVQKLQLQAKITSLSSQIQQKSILLQSTADQLANQKSTAQKYKNKCISYQKQLSDTTTISLNIHKEEVQILKSIFKDQITKYQSIVKDKDEKINQLRSDIASLRERLKDNAININSMKSKQTANDAIMTILKQKIAKSQSKLQQIISQSTKHKQQQTRYQQKCMKYRQQAQQLKNMIDQAQRKVQQDRKRRKDESIQVDIEDKVTEQLKKLANRYQNLLEQTKIYKNQFKIQFQSHHLLQQITILKNQNTHLKKTIEKLQIEIEQNFNKQKMHFESLIFSQQSKTTESKAFINDIKQELIGLESQLIQKQQIQKELFDKLKSIAVSK